MPVERSAGIIIFRNTPQGRKYLVIRVAQKHIPKPDFWDFSKGILDKGEKGLEAARRELKEETGIKKIELMPNFKATVRYFTRRNGKPVPKFVAMFLGETKTNRVKLSWEHDKYEWLAYKGARKRITLPSMKKATEKTEKIFKNYLLLTS